MDNRLIRVDCDLAADDFDIDGTSSEELGPKCEGGRKPAGGEAAFLPAFQYSLENLHVLGLPALRPLGHVELNGLAFLQRAESVGLNCGEVDKNVLAVCSAQKSEAFGVVKPLHCTLFHYSIFLLILKYR